MTCTRCAGGADENPDRKSRKSSRRTHVDDLVSRHVRRRGGQHVDADAQHRAFERLTNALHDVANHMPLPDIADANSG